MRERGKGALDRDVVAQPQMPRLVKADNRLPKPIIQMEKEEEMPPNRVISEICTVDICSS